MSAKNRLTRHTRHLPAIGIAVLAAATVLPPHLPPAQTGVFSAALAFNWLSLLWCAWDRDGILPPRLVLPVVRLLGRYVALPLRRLDSWWKNDGRTHVMPSEEKLTAGEVK